MAGVFRDTLIEQAEQGVFLLHYLCRRFCLYSFNRTSPGVSRGADPSWQSGVCFTTKKTFLYTHFEDICENTTKTV
jgi:thiamine biosynthesis protein ThiC